MVQYSLKSEGKGRGKGKGKTRGRSNNESADKTKSAKKMKGKGKGKGKGKSTKNDKGSTMQKKVTALEKELKQMRQSIEAQETHLEVQAVTKTEGQWNGAAEADKTSKDDKGKMSDALQKAKEKVEQARQQSHKKVAVLWVTAAERITKAIPAQAQLIDHGSEATVLPTLMFFIGPLAASDVLLGQANNGQTLSNRGYGPARIYGT